MPSAHAPNIPNPTLSIASRVRPASPSDFDGDREQGRAFLNSCSIYFAICSDHFANDQARIHWALSFFKSDQAARFANKVLRNEWSRLPHYPDWKTFKTDFVDHFTPNNEQLSALTRLEGASCYQGKDSVEEYIDRFTELIDLAEYHDNKMVVIKFRKGLEPTTQNRVALLGSGAPDFDDPEGWYEMARRVARNREANDTFIEANQNHSRVTPRTLTIPPKPVGVTPRTLAAIRQAPTPATMTQKDGPTPMDVDRARA